MTVMKKYHHFRFPSSEPGVVYTKFHSDDMEEEKHFLLKKTSHPWCPNPTEYPSLVLPKGLSAERQWYLFDSIRQFCVEEDRDVTCPEPSIPRPEAELVLRHRA